MKKTWICIFVSAAALLAAEKPAAKKSGAASPAAKNSGKAAPAAVTLPPGAVETAPATWEYTAPDGTKWIYRKTPFGLARFQDKPQKAASAERKDEAPIKAIEDGDSVRFERPGPFGTYKWTRKKSELDETERQAWERSRSAPSAAPAKQEQSER